MTLATDRTAVNQSQKDMESIAANAETRLFENEKELQKLESELRRTIGKDKRGNILANIQTLISERENLFDKLTIH